MHQRSRWIVLIGSSIAVTGIFVAQFLLGNEQSVPESIAKAAQQVFDRERCTTAVEAEGALRQRLDLLGYTDWTVSAGSETQTGECVTATVDVPDKEVVLIPALRPEVRKAMQDVTDMLIDRCLAKEEAVGHVTAVLRALGETDVQVRTDGPLTAPLKRVDEVARHVEAGCWVYSGTGWTAEGSRVYYVSGR
jgi:hypothetical protein